MHCSHCERDSVVPEGGDRLGADDVMRRILAMYEAGNLVTVCGWCQRVELDGEWLLAPRAAITAIDAEYTLSHSICPECAAGQPSDVQ
jgi:hypothetical protein